MTGDDLLCAQPRDLHDPGHVRSVRILGVVVPIQDRNLEGPGLRAEREVEMHMIEDVLEVFEDLAQIGRGGIELDEDGLVRRNSTDVGV